MLTRSHRLLSVAIVEAGVIASENFLSNPASGCILLVATAVGASLPDIDEYNSSVSRKSLINFSLLLKHRGITHSLLGWLVFSVGLFLLMNLLLPIKIKLSLMLPNYWASLWLGLVIGYFLHLIEDSFSYQGVHWLAPLTKVNYHKKHFRYKVGGFFERLLVLLSILAILVMSVYWIILIVKPLPRA